MRGEEEEEEAAAATATAAADVRAATAATSWSESCIWTSSVRSADVVRSVVIKCGGTRSRIKSRTHDRNARRWDFRLPATRTRIRIARAEEQQGKVGECG